jgi:hypothetical protein
LGLILSVESIVPNNDDILSVLFSMVLYVGVLLYKRCSLPLLIIVLILYLSVKILVSKLNESYNILADVPK